MHRRQRSLMTSIHRLEHVECLRATDLANDDPVRPHAQRISNEIANRNLPLTFDIGRARLETERVTLPEPKLRGVFDRHDPVGVRNRLRYGIEQWRFPAAGTT